MCNTGEVKEAKRGIHEGVVQSISSFKDTPDLQ
jgi:hypothetical protein